MSGMYRNPTARMDIDFTRKNEFAEYKKLATDLKALQEFLEHVSSWCCPKHVWIHTCLEKNEKISAVKNFWEI